MKYVTYYRCPECHHVIEKEQLFGGGCPLCGWTSPLKGGVVPQAKRGLHVKELLADIFDEPDCFRIITELPGIAEDDIKTRFDPENRNLVIFAPNHGCYKEVRLPTSAVGKITTSYKNGVLEVRVGKHDD